MGKGRYPGKSHFADTWLFALLALAIADAIHSLAGSVLPGVGALWVRPYHETTRALFYEQLKRQ